MQTAACELKPCWWCRHCYYWDPGVFNNWCLIRSHGRNACYSLTLLVSQLKRRLQTQGKTVSFWKRNKHINKSNQWIMDGAKECICVCVCVCVCVCGRGSYLYSDIHRTITCPLIPLLFSVLVKLLISCNPLWACMQAHFLLSADAHVQHGGVRSDTSVTSWQRGQELLISSKVC